MTAVELALSNSTNSCRFGQPGALPIAVGSITRTDLDVDAVRFVDDAINNEPVVLFALEWCEFSWSVRKFFSRMNIAFRSVDLDTIKYQRNDIGGKIRAVLNDRIGSPTIPQIFVGGHHIGGCTELFDAMRDGSLQRQLDDNGIAFDRSVDFDPYELLPKWVQPRKSA
jgi:cysteine synthase A